MKTDHITADRHAVPSQATTVSHFAAMEGRRIARIYAAVTITLAATLAVKELSEVYLGGRHGQPLEVTLMRLMNKSFLAVGMGVGTTLIYVTSLIPSAVITPISIMIKGIPFNGETYYKHTVTSSLIALTIPSAFLAYAAIHDFNGQTMQKDAQYISATLVLATVTVCNAYKLYRWLYKS